jgi:Na+/melibiose symporter-like transporter
MGASGFLSGKEDRMTKRPWSISPKTTSGKWSLGLIISMPILFIIGTSFTNSLYQSIPAGNTILEDIAARPALALTMLAGMAAGVSAFITGLVAILRQKEIALLVYASTVIGALLILFLMGEIAFPH